jgi:hypothetical protein
MQKKNVFVFQHEIIMQDKYQTTQYNIKLCCKIIKTMQNTKLF